MLPYAQIWSLIVTDEKIAWEHKSIGLQYLCLILSPMGLDDPKFSNPATDYSSPNHWHLVSLVAVTPDIYECDSKDPTWPFTISKCSLMEK